MATLQAGMPDVVIIESNVPGAEGVADLVARLRQFDPGVGIVVTSVLRLPVRHCPMLRGGRGRLRPQALPPK